jgi:hypothetical protein
VTYPSAHATNRLFAGFSAPARGRRCRVAVTGLAGDRAPDPFVTVDEQTAEVAGDDNDSTRASACVALLGTVAMSAAGRCRYASRTTSKPAALPRRCFSRSRLDSSSRTPGDPRVHRAGHLELKISSHHHPAAVLARTAGLVVLAIRSLV